MALHSLTTNAWSTDMTNNKHLTRCEAAQRMQREPITLQKWRIANDVVKFVRKSKHPIVLTERREHAETINSMLLKQGIDSIVLKGAMRAAERGTVEKRLTTAQVIVATGIHAGDGFDLTRLDTLFLATSIAWKGSLAQYAGRIHRESVGKECVTIHDYVDCSMPMM
jgi:superfamily II DNA or RNA helicase